MALLPLMAPFTHWLAFESQPSELGDGDWPLAHWSRFADAFASVNVVVAVPDVVPVAVTL